MDVISERVGKVRKLNQSKKHSVIPNICSATPLLSQHPASRRTASMSFKLDKCSPLVQRLLLRSDVDNGAPSRFKFGVKDIVDNEIFINKNAVRKKKKKIEEEYKIDVSTYPPTRHQLRLQAMRKELDHLNAYNEREMWKIKKMRRKRKPKQVVVKMMNLNQAFQAQVPEIKPEKSVKSRKAPL